MGIYGSIFIGIFPLITVDYVLSKYDHKSNQGTWKKKENIWN